MKGAKNLVLTKLFMKWYENFLAVNVSCEHKNGK